jgi:hypothetical protein
MRIVTVYLGNSIPDYFWMHIRHLLRIQAEYQIDVVTSCKIDSEPLSDMRLNYHTYTPRIEVSESLDSLAMDAEFRNGFWRYSLERLFAVTDHHKKFPQESLIHIESDVLPLRNFPFHTFKNSEKLAWSRVDSHRDVAAIVFSPNVAASTWLSEKMMSEIGIARETDDMKVLAEISAKNWPEIEVLPSMSHQKSNLRNWNLNSDEADFYSISANFTKFNGIFDPAGIGIWLTGTEPRNYFGVTKKFDSKSNVGSKAFINPGNVDYSFDDQGRLMLTSEGELTQVYSLHIHSKNLKYFSDQFERHICQDVQRSVSRRVQLEFSPRVLLTLIIQNLQNRTLIQFLSWLPGIRRLKELNARRKSV